MNTTVECPRCGKVIAAGDHFCAGCGWDVSVVQSSAETKHMSLRQSGAVRREQLEALQKTTAGEYDIVTELGVGGMATVYLAHDLALDRNVAIKVMSPTLFQREGMVERFRREARTAASLTHPHIIPIYAVRETERFFYFVMKCVEGRTLDSITKDVGKLPIRMVQAIYLQIASALGYAHRQGVVHRDIKPGNIMIDNEGWAVITDFGIAKVTDAEGLTLTGVTVGTPTYMSPEQCSSGEVSGASDQYSLGVVTYEMLAGKAPFKGPTLMGIMLAHVNETPTDIMSVRPECPPTLGRAVMRMLAKSPLERFPNMEEAVAAIGANPLAHDDPVRTELINLAKTGGNVELISNLQVPSSPIPIKPTTSGVVRALEEESQKSFPPTAAPVPDTMVGTDKGSKKWVVIAAAAVLLIGAGAVWQFGLRGAPAAPDPVEPQPPTTTVSAPPAVASLNLSPPAEPLEPGNSVPLTAVVRDSGGNPLDRSVTWQSSNDAVASVADDGLVTALAPGTAQITARTGTHVASASVVVSEPPPPQRATGAPSVASVVLSPSSTSLNVGETRQLTARARAGNGSTISGRPTQWTTSNSAVAAVSSSGVVTGIATGTARITARVEGRAAVATITVAPVAVASVDVSSPPASIQVGETVRLSATARAADGSPLQGRTTTWTSSNEGVASVTDGVVTARGGGTASITATTDGRSRTVTINVAAPPVEPTPQPVDATPAIDAVIDQYESALHSRDLEALMQVFPSISQSEIQTFRLMFERERNFSATTRRLSGVTMLSNQLARTTVERVLQTSRTRSSDTVTVTFERVGETWRIRSIDY